MAGEHRDGVIELRPRDANIGQLSSGALQLRLGQRDVGHRDNATLEAILCQLQILLVRTDRLLEQHAVGIETLHLKVVGCEFGLIQESRAFEIRRTRLRDCGICGDAATNAPPDIGLVGDVERHVVEVAVMLRCASPGMRRGWCCRDGGISIGRRDAYRGPRGPILRFCRDHVLIRDVHLILERVEGRLVEQPPPLAPQRRIIGLRGRPS